MPILPGQESVGGALQLVSPAERRARIISLLAKIDQDIAEARELVEDDSLSPEERQQANGQLAFYESAAKRTEIQLRKC